MMQLRILYFFILISQLQRQTVLYSMNLHKICYLIAIFVLSLQNQYEEESSWIVAADPSASIQIWEQSMPKSGKLLSWSLRQSSQNITVKIVLSQKRSSSQSIKMFIVFNTSQSFDTTHFQANALVFCSFFQGNDLVSERKSKEPLSVMINNERITISGDQFYIWMRLKENVLPNLALIYLLMALFIIKTEGIAYLKHQESKIQKSQGLLKQVANFFSKRSSTQRFFTSALLAYVCVLYRGSDSLVDQFSFQNKHETFIFIIFLAFSTYIAINYIIFFFGLFQKLLNSFNIVSTLGINFILSVFSFTFIYFIFVQLSLIALIPLVIAELTVWYRQPNKQFSLPQIGAYSFDVLLFIYLHFYPFYPHQFHLNKIAFTAIIALMILQFFLLTRSTSAKPKISTNSPKKKKK